MVTLALVIPAKTTPYSYEATATCAVLMEKNAGQGSVLYFHDIERTPSSCAAILTTICFWTPFICAISYIPSSLLVMFIFGMTWCPRLLQSRAVFGRFP
jgi:hypothetical protein